MIQVCLDFRIKIENKMYYVKSVLKNGKHIIESDTYFRLYFYFKKCVLFPNCTKHFALLCSNREFTFFFFFNTLLIFMFGDLLLFTND